MTLTQRAQATAAGLCFAFTGIFAVGMASSTPAPAAWLAEIEAAHQIHAIEALKASDVFEAPMALRACQAAKAAAAEEIEI